MIANDAFAAGCVYNGTGLKHATMIGTVTGHQAPSRLKKGDEVGRFTFVRDGANTGIGNCSAGATVHAYTSYSEATTTQARYYGEIDGRPAYYTSAGGNDYAYVLYDRDSGTPFRTNPGATIAVKEGGLFPINAEAIIYAAKDNPGRFNGGYIGAVLFSPYDSGGGTTGVGYSYTLRGSFSPPAASCEISGGDALNMVLKPISTNELLASNPKSREYSYAALRVDCNGDNVSTKIKLQNASSGFASYNGKNLIIKGDNDGNLGQASGAGFIVHLQNKDGWGDLVENEWTTLNNLQSGSNTIGIFAFYGRYKNEVKAGKVSATAQYVLEFD